MSCLLPAVVIPVFEKAATFSTENGLWENTQVFILGLILLTGIAGLFRRTSPETKLFSTGLILLSINMILRELDVEDLPVPAWVIWAGSGTGRNLLLATAWMSLLGFCACNRRLTITALQPFTSPRVWIWLIFAATLLLSSLFFENNQMIEPEQAQLAEELFECAGYLALLAAAINGVRRCMK